MATLCNLTITACLYGTGEVSLPTDTDAAQPLPLPLAQTWFRSTMTSPKSLLPFRRGHTQTLQPATVGS